MDPVLIVGLLAAGYFVLKSGALGGTAAMPAGGVPVSNFATGTGLQSVAPTGVSSRQILTGAVGAGTAGLTAATTPAGAFGLTGVAAGAVVGGIGAVVGIGLSLLAAHEQRKKQATSENSAMNAGVATFDDYMRTVNAAYNSRQITRQQAIQLLEQGLRNYASAVAPYIQPGRNGCGITPQGTMNCPSGNPALNYCSGSIGAACCVGCADLWESLYSKGGAPLPAPGAIVVLQSGKPGQSYTWKVFGSKYGGITREGYTLNWA